MTERIIFDILIGIVMYLFIQYIISELIKLFKKKEN